MNFKAQIAPKGLQFNVSNFRISDKYATILTVISYPRYVGDGYLSDITNISGVKMVIKHIPVPFSILTKMLNKELAELRELLVVHNERRAQLVSLLEQSLSEEEIERESLTASFVKKVLVSFGVFTNDEISKLTKMIIFPEDGLYEYDRGYEERSGRYCYWYS